MSTKEKCELSCITIASLFLLVTAVACSVLAGINFSSYKSFSDNYERAEFREPDIAYIVGIVVCDILFSLIIVKSHCSPFARYNLFAEAINDSEVSESALSRMPCSSAVRTRETDDFAPDSNQTNVIRESKEVSQYDESNYMFYSYVAYYNLLHKCILECE